MANYVKVLVIAVCWLLVGVSSRRPVTRDDLLDWCVDPKNGKSRPGPEDWLHEMCSPWKHLACCTGNVTRDIHLSGMGRFTWNHCGDVKPLSLGCRRHFIQDLCFYECEPNLGPWSLITWSLVHNMNIVIHKERFYQVPLCASDCEAWFQDCRQEFTCVDNWITKFDWKDGVNHCPASKPCRTYESIFGNAETFCNNVWDHSWKYVADTESCMRLYFNESFGNPNREVAEERADRLIADWNGETAGQSPLACSVFLLILTLLVVTIFTS